jgi:hypothetical protein
LSYTSHGWSKATKLTGGITLENTYKIIGVLVAICLLALVAGEINEWHFVKPPVPESPVYFIPPSILDVVVTPLPTPTPAPMVTIKKIDPSKYVPINKTYTDGKGTLEIVTRAANNIMSYDVLITPISDNVTPVDHIALNPNGKYDGRYPPGKYYVYLKDGNAGKPESTMVNVTAGYWTTVSFIGHSVSTRYTNDSGSVTPAIITPQPTVKPQCRQWCEHYFVYHPEVNHTVTKCGKTSIIVDHEAYTAELAYMTQRCGEGMIPQDPTDWAFCFG